MTPGFIRKHFGDKVEVISEHPGFVASMDDNSFLVRYDIGDGQEYEASFPLDVVDPKDACLLREGACVMLRVIDPGLERGLPGMKLAVSFISEGWSKEELDAARQSARDLRDKLGWD